MNTVNEITIGYKSQYLADESFQSSRKVSKFLYSIWDDDITVRERFYILLLNQGNIPTGIYLVGAGGVSATSVDPKLVFSVALKSMAPSIILAHNHPSGTMRPSQSDISVTKRIQKGADLLDIRVVDHIILCNNGGKYFSFADEGLL